MQQGGAAWSIRDFGDQERRKQISYHPEHRPDAIASRRAIAYLEESQSPWLARLTRKRGQRTERLFWQSGGGYDRNITAPRTLLRMIDYTHEHPPRRGLLSDPRDWHGSSVRYDSGGDSPIPMDPIPPEWLATGA